MSMFKQLKSSLLAIGLIAVSASALADASISAVGSGWCNTSYCNNTNSGSISNTFAGNHSGDFYRDWFAFDVSNESVSAATVSIWNAGNNYSDDSAATYSLSATSGFSFAGLMNGASFGSVTAHIADTGISHYVDVVFNSAGINFLNTHLGTRVVFGGNVTGVGPEVQFFGYTGGTPTAVLNTVSAVPEPESYAMMLAGLGLMGVIARRRRRDHAV